MARETKQTDVEPVEERGPEAPLASRGRIFGRKPGTGGKAEGLSSSGMALTGEEPSTSVEARARVHPPIAKTLRAPSQYRYMFESCISAAEAALSSSGNVMERANAIDDLRTSLERLYARRQEREVQFGDFIAHLQGLLMARGTENINDAEIEAVTRVLRQCSKMTSLTDPEARRLESILVKAGCDVFRELL